MGNRIAELLEEQGYESGEFAKRAGVSEASFSQILDGTKEFENAGISEVLRMANTFGVTVEYLSGEVDFPKYVSDKDH